MEHTFLCIYGKSYNLVSVLKRKETGFILNYNYFEDNIS